MLLSTKIEGGRELVQFVQTAVEEDVYEPQIPTRGRDDERQTVERQPRLGAALLKRCQEGLRVIVGAPLQKDGLFAVVRGAVPLKAGVRRDSLIAEYEDR